MTDIKHKNILETLSKILLLFISEKAVPKPEPKYQALTELVLQTFNSMPAWIPGKRNAEFVSVQIFPGEENES
ncbi:hypothetical protein AGMMS49982_23840 [Bacteroidia bacterium]|nr:hypothetical protein AGMMS49982_23840 [Bacteroidia bacterium]